MWGVIITTLALIAVVCCVSQTSLDKRFNESESLGTPAHSITVADPNNFTFAAVGDLHIGTDTARFTRILQAAQAEGDEFVVCLGDMIDKGKLEEYQAYLAAIASSGFSGKILHVIGNHEVFDDGWNHYKSLIGASHYRTRIGNTLFVALDTGDGSVGGPQADWLKDRMGEGSPQNTIIITHYLPTVPGISTYLRLSDDFEAMSLMKTALDGGVKAWLGGHYHSYALGDVEGVQYLLAGGGGGRRMDPIRDYFFVQVRVAGDRITFDRKVVQ